MTIPEEPTPVEPPEPEPAEPVPGRSPASIDQSESQIAEALEEAFPSSDPPSTWAGSDE